MTTGDPPKWLKKPPPKRSPAGSCYELVIGRVSSQIWQAAIQLDDLQKSHLGNPLWTYPWVMLLLRHQNTMEDTMKRHFVVDFAVEHQVDIMFL